MSVSLFAAWSRIAKPVIGMLHLPPLPGSPKFAGDAEAILPAVMRDARALAEGGVAGLMLENFFDVPFYPRDVPTHVATWMTMIALEVRQKIGLPLGINVLRNDGCTAMAVAAAAGAQFIRVNVLCGARVADQGILQGIAHDLLRLRTSLNCDIKIFADVDVKHSAALAVRAIDEEVRDTIHRGLADAVIVSGAATGKPVELAKLRAVKSAAGKTPVFLGSGVTARTIRGLARHADGFIVGTSFKADNQVSNPVDLSRVKSLMRGL